MKRKPPFFFVGVVIWAVSLAMILEATQSGTDLLWFSSLFGFLFVGPYLMGKGAENGEGF